MPTTRSGQQLSAFCGMKSPMRFHTLKWVCFRLRFPSVRSIYGLASVANDKFASVEGRSVCDGMQVHF